MFFFSIGTSPTLTVVLLPYGQQEDQQHIFFSCPVAAQVWSVLWPLHSFLSLQVADLWAHQVF